MFQSDPDILLRSGYRNLKNSRIPKPRNTYGRIPGSKCMFQFAFLVYLALKYFGYNFVKNNKQVYFASTTVSNL